jgi:alpha-amylase/alpha-mannosidase (GH57 family)
LREALDLLRDELAHLFEKEGQKIFPDVWKARNGYIEVILDRSPQRIRTFFDQYGLKDLDEEIRIKGLRLLEMQRHALQMFASCGWFFADLSGLETILILQHAVRAIQLAEELTGQKIEEKFIQLLSQAKSNLSEMGKGDQVYRRLVKPKCVTLEKVVNHFVISSLFDGGDDGEKKIFSYRVEKIRYERTEKDQDLLVMGQVRVTSEIIPESKEFLFGLIPSSEEVFRVWISEKREGLHFDTLKEKGRENFGKGEGEMAKVLTSFLGNRTFTMRDTFKEERQAIFKKLLQKEYDEHCQTYADLFDRTKQAVEALSREGLEIPYEIRVAAEVTLSDRLFQEINELKRDFKKTKERGEIDRIVEEAGEHGYHLRKEKSLLILKEILKEKMIAIEGSRGPNLSHPSEQIEEAIALFDLIKKWDFEISLEEAQNSMGQILDECVRDIEKCWWGEEATRPFPLNLITLAEKLGFNVEKFAKMSSPGVSSKQS